MNVKDILNGENRSKINIKFVSFQFTDVNGVVKSVDWSCVPDRKSALEERYLV